MLRALCVALFLTLFDGAEGKRIIAQAKISSCFHFAMRFAPAECSNCFEADWSEVNFPLQAIEIPATDQTVSSKKQLKKFWKSIISTNDLDAFNAGTFNPNHRDDSFLSFTQNLDLDFSITANVNMPHLKVAIFTDENDDWDRLYYSDRACPQKYSGARCTMDLALLPESSKTYQFNNNASGAVPDWKERVTYNGKMYCPLNTRRSWIYVALLNFDLQGCYADKKSWRCTDVGPVMNVSYDFSLTNPENSFSIFSDEEARMLGFVISMLTVSVFFLLGPLLLVWWILTDIDHMHATVWLLFASVGFYILGLLCHLVHYGEYSVNGVGNEAGRVAGHVFFAFADITMFELVLLIGYGWTIVRSRLSANTAMLHAVFITFYALTDLTALGWYENQRGGFLSQARVIFFWESGPGYLLLALRVLGAFIYVCVMTFTVRRYRRKVRFYCKFTVLALFYTLVPSIIVAIAFTMPPQEREQIAYFGDNIVLFFTYLIFLVMYNPWLKCVLGFPFHTRKSLMVLNDWERKAGSLPAKLKDDATELQIMAHLMKLIRSLSASVQFLDAKSVDLEQLFEGFTDPTRDEDLPGLKPKATMQNFGSKDVNIHNAILGGEQPIGDGSAAAHHGAI